MFFYYNIIPVRNLYKIVLTIILVAYTATLAFADSNTFPSAIYSVSPGYDFSIEYFPVSTLFGYNNDEITLSPELTHQASVGLETGFYLSNPKIDPNYAYDTGRPRWILRKKEYENYNFKNEKENRSYFAPEAYIEGYITQGFGQNPLNEEKEPLVKLRFLANTTYLMALESLDTSFSGKDFLFVDDNGNTVAPFGGYMNAFPWLSGDRKLFNNYFSFTSYWNINKTTGRGSYDGIYANLSCEFGPSWFFNTNQYGIMSDYYKLSAYLEEKLTLYNSRQKDGTNWFTVHVGHSNSYQYVGGDVVPMNKIPSDRFRNTVSDRLWLEFQFPQFLVGDCYSYLRFSLNNNLYFGHVVNEVDQSTKAAELISSLSAYYHVRIFGFIYFEYSFGFNLFSGIWGSHPGFYQMAAVTFNVSL